MGPWLLLHWLLVLLGLLWVKRRTGDLRCNAFSAALAAIIFAVIYGSCYYPFLLYHEQMSQPLLILGFLFVWIGLIPTASFLTLLLGHWLIPWFKVDLRQLERLTAYLTGWTFLTLFIISMLQILGFLLMLALFGGGAGMPRMTTRVSNDDYYHW